jgi:hypothetical protein
VQFSRGYSNLVTNAFMGPRRFLVFGYQKDPTRNFEVFLPQQRPDFLMYYRGEPYINGPCPEPINAAESFAKYGLAVRGQVASCTTKEPGFEQCGATCAFSGPEAPPIPYHPQPRTLLALPLENSTVSGDFYLTGVVTGDPTKLDIPGQYRMQIDGGQVGRYNGLQLGAFPNMIQSYFRAGSLAPGPHTISVWLADKSGAEITGSRSTVNFTVRDEDGRIGLRY